MINNEIQENINTNTTSMQGYNKIKQLEKLEGKPNDSIRAIIILYNAVEIVNKKKHLKIVGIDVYTGTTVLIVDTNSMKYGLHSYQDSFINLKPYSVIKAPFKFIESDEYHNILRIAGKFQLIGDSKIILLKEKYDLLGYTSFVKKFDEIDTFFADDMNKKKNLHIIVRFSGSKLKLYKNKEQLKIGTHFANLHEDVDGNKHLGRWYIGLALLSCKKNKSGSLNITVLKLIGDFFIKNTVNDELYKYLNDNEEKEDVYGLRHDRSFRHSDLYDVNEKYITDDYTLDGCDDDYFSDWEDDYSEYCHEENDNRIFDEPMNDYGDEYYEDELNDEFDAMLKDAHPELSEDDNEKEEDIYEIKVESQTPSLHYLFSNSKYEIEDIKDDNFSINFSKTSNVKTGLIEADIEDIPF
jgi:hypothetical protein